MWIDVNCPDNLPGILVNAIIFYGIRIWLERFARFFVGVKNLALKVENSFEIGFKFSTFYSVTHFSFEESLLSNTKKI